MGNNIKRNAASKRPIRKATFSVKLKKGVRQFTPVNKRAKRYAKAIGVKRLTANDLRTIKANGAGVYVYTSTGNLVTAVL